MNFKKLKSFSTTQFLILIAVFIFGIIIGINISTQKEIKVYTANDENYKDKLFDLIKGAKKEILIIMFEFGYYKKYPNAVSNRILRELIKAKHRGVKVKIILESGEPFLIRKSFIENLEYITKKMEENEIDVRYDPRGKTTHAKLVIVDREKVLLGSTNWTYYGLLKNHETNALIVSKEIAKKFAEYFNKVWYESTEPKLILQEKKETDIISKKENEIEVKFIKTEKILSPDVVYKNAKFYDRKYIKVAGVVSNLKKKFSRRGNPYCVFKLFGERYYINVYIKGHPDIFEGQKVIVNGKFWKIKKVGKYVFKNEIEASEISPWK